MNIIVSLAALVLLVGILRLGELYTQIIRYQKYWDRVNEQSIASDDIVYIAFGDSAAQGVGASRPEKGYVGVIAKELAEKTNKKIKVINLSKSGAKVKDVLTTQLPAYEKMNISNPKIFTIEIGANDIKSFDEKSFAQEMNELMGKLPKGTVISDLPSFKGSRRTNLEARVVKANAIIYSIGAKHGLVIANLHERVDKNHGVRAFAADLFHPSDYSYHTNWAAAFLEKLEPEQ